MRLISTTAAAFGCLAVCHIAWGDGPVKVTLHNATVGTPIVRMADVADLSGGTPQLRDRIGSLDLADASQAPLQLDRRLISIRLMLAGFDREDFAIAGPASISIEAPTAAAAPVSDEQFLAAAVAMFERQFDLRPDELEVRLLQPIRVRKRDGIVDVRAVAISQPPPGRFRLQYLLYDGAKLADTTAATIEVRVRQEIPIATRDLPIGTELTSADYITETRLVGRPIATMPAEAIAGQRARKFIRAGEALEVTALAAGPRRVRPTLIRPRDSVRVTAKSGNLRVVLPAAEALQSGKKGDMVRVRNVQSQKVITGRVVAAGEVEVPL